MKKIACIILSVCLLMSLGLVVSADSSFIASPSNIPAPTIVEFTPVIEEGVDPGIYEGVTLAVTAYSDRASLPEKQAEEIQVAMEEIQKEEDLTVLVPELVEIVEELKVPAKNLAISDFFDISAVDKNGASFQGTFNIAIEVEMAEKFVALLHCKDGVWEAVKSAKITGNNQLTFSASDFSPFAVVVNNEAPATTNWLIIALLVLLVLIIVVIAVQAIRRSKKKTKKAKASKKA